MKVLQDQQDFLQLLEDIKRHFNGETYELIGETILFKSITFDDMFDAFDLDHNMAVDFTVAVSNYEKKQFGPYDTSKYFSIIDGANQACSQFMIDGMGTRRAIFQFPVDHCFQSIQFFVRQGKISVVCNMRSCNAVDNLLFDAYICMGLTHIISNKLFGGINTKPTDIYMQIGSLHIFKGDEDVL